MAKQYTVSVFDTVTSRYEEIAVTKEVYDEYRRGEWRISKNNDKHRAGEIPFSALIGGEDGCFENFHEFVTDEGNPETLMEEVDLTESVRKVVSNLSEEDRALIDALFFKGIR